MICPDAHPPSAEAEGLGAPPPDLEPSGPGEDARGSEAPSPERTSGEASRGEGLGLRPHRPQREALQAGRMEWLGRGRSFLAEALLPPRQRLRWGTGDCGGRVRRGSLTGRPLAWRRVGE